MKVYFINITLFGLIVLITNSCNTNHATVHLAPAINVKILSVKTGYQLVQFDYSASTAVRHLSTTSFIVLGRIKGVCVQILGIVKHQKLNH